MEEKELVSFVVTTKNNRSTIFYTLKSIKRFTECSNSDVEVIVVDGRSNDGTLNIAHEFVTRYKNSFYDVKLVQDPGKSLPYARNIGFKHSQGETVVFLDGDMILQYGFIKHFKKVLSKDYDVIAPGVEILKLDYSTEIFNLLVNIISKNSLNMSKPDIIPQARIFSREVLEKLNGYPPLSRYFGEDRIATALAIIKGSRYAYIPELKILKIDEPSFKAYFKKHVRYGEGIEGDLNKAGRRILRDYISVRRLTYLNILVPVLSVLYVLKAKQQHREANLTDLLEVFMLKYAIDLAMLLGELKAILKRC